MKKRPIVQGWQNGNAAMEYTLIGAAVCMVCVLMLLQTGQNMEEYFSGLKTDMQNTIRQSEKQVALNQDNLSRQGTLQKSISRVAQDAYGEEQAAIFTAGANGEKNKTTDRTNILHTFDPAAENLSPNQQEALKNLANQAHKIAEIQAHIEAVSKASGGDVNKFHDARIQYNNDSYSVYYLSSTMFNKELKNYDQLKLKLLESGTLSINSLDYINQLTNNIQNRASTIHSLTHSNQATAITALDASNETHGDGKKICQQGQLDDNGKKCK